jgi:fatty-acyl-CoA synthase
MRKERLSYVHRGGDIPLLGSTIEALFRDIVASFPNHEALVSVPQEVRLTYAALHHEVRRLGKALMALGLSRGERVGIWSTNNLEWVLLQIATAHIGAVLVNINPAYRPRDLKHALERARVQALFLIPSFKTSNYVDMVCELCPRAKTTGPDGFSSTLLPDLRHLVVYDPEDVMNTQRPQPGFLTWGELLGRSEKISDEELDDRATTLDPDDPINIQFTSGTTGFPKAVVLTHHNILNNAYFAAKIMRLNAEDRLCVAVPFYHCFGMVVANLVCITVGATIVIPSEYFEPTPTLAAIDQERCTAVHGVPTMFIAELEHPDFHRFDHSSLRTGIMAGAPCPPELVRRVMEDMGCKEILIGYGETEASPITHLTRPEDSFERRVGTVGTNLPHQECKIIDVQSGAVLPTGQQGEVCFRGYHVMRGYYGQEDATHEAIDEAGWLHSGDIGVLDDDGYLRITGRLKDMIIRGGENIYPVEIENFYFTHPKVADIAVFGVPDEKMGEEVGAWIKLHEGVDAHPEEFRDYAKEKISHFKIPRYVWVVEEFPMTVTGKIQKFRIREIVSGWLKKVKKA